MKKRSIKPILITLLIIFILVIAAAIAVLKLNTYSLVLSVDEPTIVLEYGVDELPEITALCKGTLLNRDGIPVKTTLDGNLDLEKLGTYEVTYTATYKDFVLSEKRTIIVQDTSAPVINLISKPEHYTSPVGKYEEEGFSATDNYDGDLSKQVKSEEKDGIITYTVSDSSGNTATTSREIVYKDVIAPKITLKKGANLKVTIGKDFKDPGFTAEDECDGDLTDKVSVSGEVDGHKKGTYTIVYKVEDSSGNITEIERNVKVGDFEAPKLDLKGKDEFFLKLGKKFKESGFSATDNVDGDLTDKVTVRGKVNTKEMGSYTITYEVSDKAGNTTKKTRTVYVYKKQASATPVNPGNKVVYLTFDDGPGPHTERLLDILDKYGVKATFFVTNQFPDYQNMIGETHRRGHTIALHTYTHNYQKIYASEKAYFADLEKISNLCEKQTGEVPNIVRFPGGTNNTVSRRARKGIMTTLSKTMKYHGYYYSDWNVGSGDAGGTTSKKGVAKNVIAGIKKHDVSIVLQHDIKKFSVEAVDDIIFWGLKNGYTFLPMTETTPMVHFKPLN